MKTYLFIGIGGISMSALARYLAKKGHTILGVDKDLTQKTISLLKDTTKISLFIDTPSNIKHILTTAAVDHIITVDNIADDHAAVILAPSLGIPLLRRGALLAQIVTPFRLIAVGGSHGKTTTTGMITHIFQHAALDPLVFIGGIMPTTHTNYLFGSGDWAIVEADDAYKGFLHLMPTITIITSISYEHLETYRDYDDIKNTFRQFAQNTLPQGIIFVNGDVPQSWGETLERNVQYYGTSEEPIHATDIILEEKKSTFTLNYFGKNVGSFTLPHPGIHNVKNSIAAIAAARSAQIPFTIIRKALATFATVERRFEYKGTWHSTPVYEDYGHHPIEIAHTLAVFKKTNGEKGKKIVIFQPHKYSRTKHLWHEFIELFSSWHHPVYLTDVYAAGEPFDETYNGKTLGMTLQEKNPLIHYVPFDESFNLLRDALSPLVLTKEDSILCLGAGMLNQFAEKLVHES